MKTLLKIQTAAQQAPQQSSTVKIMRVNGSCHQHALDDVIVEEPIEIRIADQNGREQSIAVTMRTPGHDLELALGFLFSEGLLAGRESLDYTWLSTVTKERCYGNIVSIRPAQSGTIDLQRFSRHVYTTSSCGVCGKTALEHLSTQVKALPQGDSFVSKSYVLGLAETLKRSQCLFERTGGLHAAALFTHLGDLLVLCEDVGRHNAVDKVVGSLLLDGKLPASNTSLLVSGRASFELVQKAAMAGIPVFVAMGAPSSLALKTAHEFNMTLIGFLRGNSFNVYSGGERVLL